MGLTDLKAASLRCVPSSQHCFLRLLSECGKETSRHRKHPLTCITSLNSLKHLGGRGKDSTARDKEMEFQRD